MTTTLNELKASSIPTWEKGSQDEFERWRILNMMRMTEKDWHESLENDWGETSSATTEQKKKDLHARCLMLTKTKGIAFKMIKNIKSAKEMMKKLDDRYMGSQDEDKRGNDLLETWSKALHMKGNEYGNPNSWMELVTNTAIELEECNKEYKKSNREIMVSLVHGLPDVYDEKGIKRDLYAFIDKNKGELEKLKQQIFYEWRMHIKGRGDKKNAAGAYNTELKGGEKPICKHCGKNHPSEKCWKEHGKPKDPKDGCWICGGGHMKRHCPNRNNKKGGPKEVAFVGTTTAENHNSGAMMLCLPCMEEEQEESDDDSSEDQESICKEEPKDEGDELSKQEEDLNVKEDQEEEDEDPEPLTQDEEEVRRLEMRIGEFRDDDDQEGEAYCFTTSEVWVEVKNKSNLKNKMYLADSGANAHILVDESMVQNVIDWEQEIKVGGSGTLKSIK